MNTRILCLLQVAILTGCASASLQEAPTTSNGSDHQIRIVFDETKAHAAVAVLSEVTGDTLAVDNALRDVPISGTFDGPAEVILSEIADSVSGIWIDSSVLVEAGRETAGISLLTDRPERFSGRPCAPLQAPYFGPCAPARSSADTLDAPRRPPRKGLPYFGERLPQMPPNHFTTPLAPEIPSLVRDGD